MGKRQSMVRRLLCAGLAGLCLGALGGPVAAQADTARHHRAAEQPRRRQRRLAGGDLPDRTLLAEHPRGRSTPRPPATRRSASPSSSSSTRRSGPWKTRSASSRTSGSTCRSGSASTRRRRPSATSRPSRPTRSSARPTRSSGRASSPPRWRGVVAPPITLQVYNLVPSQGEPALFGFSALGSNIFLKSDVDWSGDYHEGFTIAVPAAAARRRDPQEPPRLHRRSPATGPS